MDLVLAEELELVPPENRSEVEHQLRIASVHEAVCEMRYEDGHVPEMEVRRMVQVREPKVQHWIERRDSFEDQTRLVYVTFYTHLDKRVVQMHLNGRHCLEQVTQKAAELLPTVQWKIFSGTQKQADFEFLNPRQVWDSIKRSPICRFYYLLVRLERLHPVKTHDAKCDNCRQLITGHRYKCTECADFDICQSCEGRSFHREHAMLRLVDSSTRVPKYITNNAPRYVFDQFNGY